jgi:hypothetical protein
MKAPLKPKGSFHEAILVVVVDLWVGKSQKLHGPLWNVCFLKNSQELLNVLLSLMLVQFFLSKLPLVRRFVNGLVVPYVPDFSYYIYLEKVYWWWHVWTRIVLNKEYHVIVDHALLCCFSLFFLFPLLLIFWFSLIFLFLFVLGFLGNVYFLCFTELASIMGESFCYCWFRVTSDMLLDLKSLELSYSVNSQIMVILIVSNENQDVLSMHVISVVTFRIMT